MDALFTVLDERFDLQRYRRSDCVAAVHDGVLAEQDDLAVADAHRGFFASLAFRADRGALPLVLNLRDELLRLPNLDDAALDQPLEHLVKDFLRRAGRGDDTARVQRHVAFLYSFRRERPNRREVLREAGSGHDLRELRRGLDAE